LFLLDFIITITSWNCQGKNQILSFIYNVEFDKYQKNIKINSKKARNERIIVNKKKN